MRKFVSIFCLIMVLSSIGIVLAQEEFFVRELQLGDTFTYEDESSGRAIAFEIVEEAPSGSGASISGVQDVWDVIANGNDTSLIGGFPRYQELMFPEEYGMAFELYGDLFDVNYTFSDGLFIISAHQNRSISFDTYFLPALHGVNVSMHLNHAIKTRPLTPNSEITDYMSYQLYHNATVHNSELTYRLYFNFTVNFENFIEFSQQWVIPNPVRQMLNATETFTYIDGRIHMELWDGGKLVYFINRTDFSCWKGNSFKSINRGTGIPEVIYYEDDRGFMVNETLVELSPLIRAKIVQIDRSKTFNLVKTNIEPITYIVTTWIDSTVIDGTTHFFTVLVDNFGITSVVSVGLFGLLALIPIIRKKKRE